MDNEAEAAAIPVVRNWSLTRSGHGITITGWVDDRRVKITNVEEVASDKDGPLVTMREGDQQYRLA